MGAPATKCNLPGSQGAAPGAGTPTVLPAPRKLALLDDESDIRIVECAVAADADIIVTGDRATLNLKKCDRIRVLSLRQFLDETADSDR